jgi:nucleotide-binding universal stress UspA family protein
MQPEPMNCLIEVPRPPGELRLHSGATASEGNGRMIPMCYDGSADAEAATDRAGMLMAGSDATVLVMWETMTRNGSLGMGMMFIGLHGDDATDAALERAALETATHGAQRATAAGLVAQPRASNRDDDITAVILAVAADVDADVIVLGTRTLTGP